MTGIQPVPVTEVPVPESVGPERLTAQQRVNQVIAQARATLTEDGTAAVVDLENPAAPNLGETSTEFPIMEPVEPEVAPPVEEVAQPAPEEPDARTVLIERQPGQTVKITFRTQEEADVIRGLQRGNLRREELHREREQLKAREDELAQFEDLLQVDRSGIIAEMLPPDAKRELLSTLLLEVGIEDAELMTALDTWRQDEAERRAARLEVENARYKSRQEINERYEVRRVERQAAATAVDVAATLAQQFIHDRPMRDAFMDDMLTDMKAWAGQMKAQHGRIPAIKPEDVLSITARRLNVYRIAAEDAKRALDPTAALPPRARPTGDQAERVAEAARKARETGSRFVAAAQQRQLAAKVPGSGVTGGTPGDQGLVPPPNQKFAERSSWLKQKLGLKR